MNKTHSNDDSNDLIQKQEDSNVSQGWKELVSCFAITALSLFSSPLETSFVLIISESLIASANQSVFVATQAAKVAIMMPEAMFSPPIIIVPVLRETQRQHLVSLRSPMFWLQTIADSPNWRMGFLWARGSEVGPLSCLFLAQTLW